MKNQDGVFYLLFVIVLLVALVSVVSVISFNISLSHTKQEQNNLERKLLEYGYAKHDTNGNFELIKPTKE